MTFGLLRSGGRKREYVLALDLGSRTTKAVWLQKRDDGYALLKYGIFDAPAQGKEPNTPPLGEHFRSILHSMEIQSPTISLALGVGETIVRYAELPQMPLPDMRQVLKTNTRLYLQQDLTDYVFDCWPVNGKLAQEPDQRAEKARPPVVPKQKVLVAGARKACIETVHTAIKQAGGIAGVVMPGLVAPINALEKAEPELFQREVVALVNLGFRHSSVCVLQEGELVLSRVLALGGDQVTQGLADVMGICYAEAEGIKLGVPGEVHDHLVSLLSPLGRELKASIDFYEHQHDRPVTQVLVSGAGAVADWIVRALQAEVVAECRPWDPTAGLERALAPRQLAELEQVAPQLSVAVGTALSTI
ncbi:MAG: pilus assembly protein PilM [Verrucomicrobiota bacterium]|nr:pilus assembly protein PilM [Limisphaera sp.]MDW8381618.1 pilus assembly protein PilM [Verrucomicrobiota bacterium]